MLKWTVDCYKGQYIHSVCSKDVPSYQDVLENIAKCEAFLKKNPNIPILLDVRKSKEFFFYKEYLNISSSFGVRVAIVGRFKQSVFFKRKLWGADHIAFFSKNISALQWLEQKGSPYKRAWRKNDSSLMCCIDIDLKGDVKRVNRAFTDFLGYEKKDVLGKEVVGLYMDTSKALSRFKNLLETYHTCPRPYFIEYRKKSGKICSGLTIEKPLIDVFGKVSGFSLNVVDASDLDLYQMGLDKVKKRLEIALEASRIGVWEFNILDNKLIWDSQMYALYGVDENKFSGAYDAWASGIHPDDLVRSEKELQMAIIGKKKFDTQFRICYPNGSIRHIRAIAKVNKNKEDQPFLMIGANWDITKEVHQSELLKKSKEESDKANRAKSDFLSHMSHEIRTPMNGVLGVASLLREDDNLTPKQKKLIDTMISSGQSMMAVLNDILDYSKINANKVVLENHQFHFHDFASSILDLFKSESERKNLLLECELDRKIPTWLVADSNRIRQVLSNLLSNAIKFTHKGFVKMTVEVQEEPHLSLCFTVCDSGIGIPDNKKDLVFKSFSQADHSTTREYGGTGLGLAISEKLVRLLGGKLEVLSEINQGSEFSFVIPVEKVNETLKQEVYDDKTYENLSVLVVDDNLVNQEIILGFLQKLGVSADLSNHGGEAVECVQSKRYDMIFMDCQMPVMDGYEASRYIRENKISEAVIIALTARAMEGEKEKCLSFGMDDYLTKPISKRMLQTTLERWVKN